MTASVAQNDGTPFQLSWLPFTNQDSFSSSVRFNLHSSSISQAKRRGLTGPHLLSPTTSYRQDGDVFKTFCREDEPISHIKTSSRHLNINCTDNKVSAEVEANPHPNTSSTPDNKYESTTNACSGLFDFIRRKKTKQYRCSRCGFTHSNFVKANKGSSGSQTRQKSRSKSVNMSHKIVIVCQNCGKRSYNHSPLLLETSYNRSMTWPLPLERITEDDAEDLKFEKKFFPKSKESRGDKVTSGRLSSKTKVEKQNGGEKSSPNFTKSELSLTNVLNPLKRDGTPLIKVFIRVRDKRIGSFIHGLKQLGEDEGIHFYFLAIVEPGCLLSDTLKGVADDTIMYDENTSIEHFIVQAAEANNVKIVLLDMESSNSNQTLVNEVTSAGLYVFQPNCSGHQQENPNTLVLSVPGKIRRVRISLPTTKFWNEEELSSYSSNENNLVNSIPLLFTAVHVAQQRFENRKSAYKAALQRGEFLPPHYLTTLDRVQVRDGSTNHNIEVLRVSPTEFQVKLNQLCDGAVIRTIRPYANISRLIYNGVIFRTSYEELPHSYRITVDQKAFVLQKISPCPTTDQDAKLFPSSAKQSVLKRSIISSKTGSSQFNTVIKQTKECLCQTLECAREFLRAIMNGWNNGDAEFERKILKAVDDFLNALNNPSLPLQELKEVMRKMTNKLPSPVERLILREMSRYASNITSMMSHFPAEKISWIISSYITHLSDQSQIDSFCKLSQPILDVVHRYRSGNRGNMHAEISSLLRIYFYVESEFQQVEFVNCIRTLMEEEEETGHVIERVFSHSNLVMKNFLILQLLKRLSLCHNKHTDEVISVLSNISTLLNETTATVALEARRILKECRKAPYEVRYNQLNSTFLSLSPHDHDLINLITDRDLFEILPQFFSHPQPEAQMTSLEIFVRRLYSESHIHSVQHLPFHPSLPALLFHFTPIPTSTNISIAPPSEEDCLSVFAAFPDFSALNRNFESTLQLFDQSDVIGLNLPAVNDVIVTSPGTEKLKSNSMTRTLNIAIVTPDDVVDDHRLHDCMQSYANRLNGTGIELVTFALHRINDTVKFHTFQANTEQFTENSILRCIHPAQTHRFDIKAQDNLEALSSSKPHIHLYLQPNGGDKEILMKIAVQDPSENELSTDWMENETELLLLEASQELEKFHHYDKASLFINFCSKMTVAKNEMKEIIRSVVQRFVGRLWRKKLTNIKFRSNLRSADGDVGSHDVLVILQTATNVCVSL